jgi:hypothetical protein
MKIGITLNEVFRDFIGQLAYTYDKYVDSVDLKKNPVTSFDLIDHFKFDSVSDLNTFLYGEAALEIFGHADQLHDNVMSLFNNFLMDIEDFTDHEVVLVSREALKSIPSTFFFLSKLGCKANNIKFVTQHEDMWNDIDVLITANPIALDSKPEGKISVKVEASYNTDTSADYQLKDITEFMLDEGLRDKILNTKITTLEEIKDND